MSEEQEQPIEEQPKREPDGPLGGERLAQARREQQISVLEVAKELHLDEPKVRALERNEFDVLGAPVFAKGHLRKYAQLVGVDEGDIFADYYKMTHTAELPPVVIGRHRVRRELSPGPWIAAIVVIIVAAAAYWWFAVRSGNGTPGAASPEAPVPEQSVDAGLPAPEQTADTAAPADEQADVPATLDAEERPAPAAEQSEPEPAPVAAGQTRITLSFSGDCWTEISDAAGQQLFFSMGHLGQSVELAGTAPFAVLFGNAENVSVRVDGSDYPISPSTPGSRTARLTILKP